MATPPNLVVAGDPGVARKLRGTGRFPAVFDVASAAELRDLSKSGQVGFPAAFMFAPGFVEDLPDAGVAVLANGLAGSGFTVLVHGFFTERGDVFDPGVQVTRPQLKMSDLLATFGATESAPAPATAQPPAASQRQAPSRPQAPAQSQPQAPAPPQAPAHPQAPVHPQAPAQPQAQAHPQAPVQPQAQAYPQAPTAGQQPPPAQQPQAPYPAPPPAPAQPAAFSPAPGQHPWSATGTPGQQPFPGQQPDQAQGPGAGSVTRHDHDALPAAASSNAWPGPQAAPPTPQATAAEARTTRRGRVIAIASAKGGVGKTSIAVNLSVYAARHLQAAGRPGTAALVDTNFQQADVARYLNVETPTILDMLQVNGALSAETVRNHLSLLPDIGLYSLLGPPDVFKADPALINAMVYRRIIAMLREAFDFVFVDTPVAELYHLTFTDLILPEADAILVPVEPNRVTLEAARSWLSAITMPQHSRNGGVDPEKLSLILNRARTDVDCGPEDVMDLMPGWRFAGMIPEDQEWTLAANNRRLRTLQAGPDLEATFREILQAVTGDPVFGEAVTMQSANGRGGMWKKLLGLNSK